jgi:hypothetical protein
MNVIFDKLAETLILPNPIGHDGLPWLRRHR